MNRAKNPTKSISFLWIPEVYPARWASGPDDVPEWDASRGCPIYATPAHVGSWKVKAPPQSPYPRLVRRSLADSTAPRQVDGDDALSEVAKLHRFLKPWREGRQVTRLQNAALRLAERYGPPYQHDENTLEAWLSLAAQAHVHLQASKLLRTEGFAVMKLELTEKRDELKRALGDNRSYKRQVDIKADARDPCRAEVLELDDLLRHAAKVEKEAPAKPTSAFRLRVATSEYDQLGHWLSLAAQQAGGPRLRLTTEGVTLEAPLGVWVRYQLSVLWQNGAEVSVCPVCDSLFLPSRKNQAYCPRKTCADKKWRENKEHRASRQS